ncbi:MAG: lipopolysaccharide biosynthesis protein [Oceanospirillaceae bacterium]|nr:lipopolysaccharide biosynthesis protein [Oceanospirillaceae bacterium]
MLTRLTNLPRALQHSLVYAAALALSKGFALIMVPIATHYLTPADYGRLDVLQTLADLLSIVIGMGLAETLFRFAGSEEDSVERRRASANIFGMALSLGALALIIGQLAAPQISQLLPGGIAIVETRLILASLALVGTILVPLAWLRMQGNPWLYLLGTAGRVALQVAIAVPLLMMGFGVVGVLTGTLLSALCLSGWLIWKQLQDTGIRFEFTRFRMYSAYGGPLIFVGMAGFILGSFDRWILADAVGTAEMAQYALAAKFGLITAVFIQPFDLWWHARRFSCLQEANGPQRCAQFAAIGVVIAMFSCLIIAAAGPTLVRVLTPEAYHQSIQYIPWLAALAALHNATSTLGFGAMSESNTVRPALIDGVAAAVALAAYLTLIPEYHAWGAIAATTLALSLRFIMMYRISQRTLSLPYPIRRLTLMLLLCLVALIVIPSSPLSWLNGVISLGALLSFAITSVMLGLIPLKRHSTVLQG